MGEPWASFTVALFAIAAGPFAFGLGVLVGAGLRRWTRPPAGPVCTGLSAFWCPIHGDCTCPDQTEDLDDPGCPLHAWNSDHPEEVPTDG